MVIIWLYLIIVWKSIILLFDYSSTDISLI